VVTISLEEVAEIQTAKDDDSYKAKPIAHYVRSSKGSYSSTTVTAKIYGQPLMKRMFST
jgi:hypothetical protein